MKLLKNRFEPVREKKKSGKRIELVVNEHDQVYPLGGFREVHAIVRNNVPKKDTSVSSLPTRNGITPILEMKDLNDGAKRKPAGAEYQLLLNPLIAYPVEVKNIFPVINIDHSHVSFDVAIRPNVKSSLQCKIKTTIVGGDSSQVQTVVINNSEVTVLRFVVGVDTIEEVQ